MITNIILDFLDGIFAAFANLFAMILNGIQKSFGVSNYCPSVAYWRDSILGAENFLKLINVFKYIGFYGGLILFAFSFFILWFGGIKELKDSVKSLIARMALVGALVMISPHILNMISDVSMDFFEKVEEVVGDGTDGELDKGSVFGSVAAELKNDTMSLIAADRNAGAAAIGELGIYCGVAVFAPGLYPLVGILYLVIKIVLLGLITWYFIKLIVEMIRRYITFSFLYISFPAIAGTLSTAYTSNIFWTYLKSFASESLCLIMTKLFLSLSIFAARKLPLNITNTIIIIAILSLGISFEQFMKDHGFSISSAGGQILDSMMSSLTRMAVVGRSALGLTAGAAITTAGFAGNTALAKFGNALNGKGISDAAALNAMNGSWGQEIAKSMVGGEKEKGYVPLTNSVKASMVNAFREGGKHNIEAMGNTLNKLSEADRNTFLNNDLKQAMFGGAKGEGELKKALGVSNLGNVHFNGTDNHGNIVGSVDSPLGEKNITIGTNAMNSNSKMFVDAVGNDMYATLGDVDTSKLDVAGDAGLNLGGNKIVETMDARSLNESLIKEYDLLDTNKVAEMATTLAEEYQDESFMNASNYSISRDNECTKVTYEGENGSSYSYCEPKDKSKSPYYTSSRTGSEHINFLEKLFDSASN